MDVLGAEVALGVDQSAPGSLDLTTFIHQNYGNLGDAVSPRSEPSRLDIYHCIHATPQRLLIAA